jgi:hypothetical protein
LAFHEDLHLPDILAADEAVEEFVQEVAEIVNEVELFRADCLLLVVQVQLVGETEFVAELVVGGEDEDESEDGADESSHIGEESIEFAESS